jgi:hypothetical protein
MVIDNMIQGRHISGDGGEPATRPESNKTTRRVSKKFASLGISSTRLPYNNFGEDPLKLMLVTINKQVFSLKISQRSECKKYLRCFF